MQHLPLDQTGGTNSRTKTGALYRAALDSYRAATTPVYSIFRPQPATAMLLHFDPAQTLLVALLFVWTGFVRSGLGFGGAALGLPLLLFVDGQPLLWLPIIGVHLLFFSGLTLGTRLHNVDWHYLRRSSLFIIPAAIVGVLGLVKLPTYWLNLFIYSISLFYGFMWLTGRAIQSNHAAVDRALLILGGYIAGTSLTGAPLMVAVYMRNVARAQLRDTLFMLWFTLVSIKMATFVALGVELHFLAALALIPVAAVGHWLGLKAHGVILANDARFKRVVGAGLALVSALGLWNLG
jgi:uncharacterized membrane protein YfcA